MSPWTQFNGRLPTNNVYGGSISVDCLWVTQNESKTWQINFISSLHNITSPELTPDDSIQLIKSINFFEYSDYRSFVNENYFSDDNVFDGIGAGDDCDIFSMRLTFHFLRIKKSRVLNNDHRRHRPLLLLLIVTEKSVKSKRMCENQLIDFKWTGKKGETKFHTQCSKTCAACVCVCVCASMRESTETCTDSVANLPNAGGSGGGGWWWWCLSARWRWR